MSQIKLIATYLAAAGLTNATLGRWHGDFKVQVTTIDEVFKAEEVATLVKAKFGLDLYVAF